jgi:YihY family inner membrane protein
MKQLNNLIRQLDRLQQSQPWSAFTYGVIKKYGNDHAGRQAALLTYYGFLSLFPLLLVLTTVTSTLGAGHPQLQNTIIKSTTNYFPVLGSQLSNHIHTLHKNGPALIIGVVLTLYGARGVADAFRYGVQHIWRVPAKERDNFPKALLKDLVIMVVGGAGFVLAAVCTGLAAGAGHGMAFRLLSVTIDLFMLFWLFTFLLNISLPQHVPVRDTRSAALVAALGLIILQAAGGLLLKRELHSLDALYSYFAIALGLLFWLYLQAQLLYYAVEVAAVRVGHLWPRSFHDKPDRGTLLSTRLHY